MEKYNTYNLPFGIDFVVEQDLVTQGTVKHPTSRGYSINCPFCHKHGLKPDRHFKYSIDVYKNVGHCMRCNDGHGIISLHQSLCEGSLSYEEAKADLLKRWQGLPSDVQIKMNNTIKIIELERQKELYPAPIEIRDEVYRKFLNQLSLSQTHKDDLLKRGLSEDEIAKGRYKTVPSVGFTTFASNAMSYEVRKQIKNHRNWGIPGFYDIRTDEPKVVRLDSGYFVPIVTKEHLISGLQIRYDNPGENVPEEQKERWSKYKWFVSNYKNLKDGCTASGCENIHYAGDWFKIPKTVYLTEGELKADVASHLLDKITGKESSFLAIVGVNNTEFLAEHLLSLKDEGLESVVICLDMDYLDKPQVKTALDNIRKLIEESSLRCSQMKWPKEYKGIDDFLLEYTKRSDNVSGECKL